MATRHPDDAADDLSADRPAGPTSREHESQEAKRDNERIGRLLGHASAERCEGDKPGRGLQNGRGDEADKQAGCEVSPTVVLA